MLGETKAETIAALQAHRKKLLDAGEKSNNTPLDPQVGSDTTFKAWDFISDKGQVTEKQLRAKFKSIESNQYNNLVEGLFAETDPESVESVSSEPARRDGEGSTWGKRTNTSVERQVQDEAGYVDDQQYKNLQ